ncbi:MAG: glycerol kinase, partial [Alphaproteobacteria bacterium]|nr:glycerol kinase [Alphaproteobacteria bacterium]
MSQVVLAIDQGTTSSRAILFDAKTNVIATAQQEFQQHFPKPGWVEHTPADIWDSVLSTARNALKAAALTGGDVAAIGITNQRETVVVWERATGKPLYNAIVWQDRRTADICASLKNAGHEPDVLQRTGLPLDPYFSATKLAWILDHVPGARARAERGELAAGTIDTFLLWKLTGGKVHATDATNASRTALFNIHTQTWDEALLGLFQVPLSLLPRVKDCTGDFGDTAPELFGKSIVIRGIAGDQ